MDEHNNHIDMDLLTRYFSGECSPAEQEAILQWKDASAENARLFSDLLEVWTSMDSTAADRNIDVDAEWNRHIREYIPSHAPIKKVSIRSTFLRIAASILILTGVSYAGWRMFSQKSVKTGIAETHQISLPDGSLVTLNAGSGLSYTSGYGKKWREVRLQGEAYFEVKKNPGLPFVIKLDGAEVKVLGTSFNVQAYKGNPNIEVTVAEGKVSVYKSGRESEKVIVVPGEQVVYLKQTEVLQKRNNTNRNFISWKTHLMVFENDSLSTIVKTLNAVYHKEFIIENQQLSRCTVTTRFENKDLLTVLHILQSTLDISFEEKDGKILIKGKGC